jgi:hypothetical protein
VSDSPRAVLVCSGLQVANDILAISVFLDSPFFFDLLDTLVYAFQVLFERVTVVYLMM